MLQSDDASPSSPSDVAVRRIQIPPAEHRAIIVVSELDGPTIVDTGTGAEVLIDPTDVDALTITVTRAGPGETAPPGVEALGGVDVDVEGGTATLELRFKAPEDAIVFHNVVDFAWIPESSTYVDGMQVIRTSEFSSFFAGITDLGQWAGEVVANGLDGALGINALDLLGWGIEGAVQRHAQIGPRPDGFPSGSIAADGYPAQTKGCVAFAISGWNPGLNTDDLYETPADAEATLGNMRTLIANAQAAGAQFDASHFDRWYEAYATAAAAVQAARQGHSVVLIGHSAGGAAAYYVAQTLGVLGYPVDLLVDIDTYTGRGKGGTATDVLQGLLYYDGPIPPNVRMVVNRYQDRSFYYHGRSLEGARSNLLMFSEHDEIDGRVASGDDSDPSGFRAIDAIVENCGSATPVKPGLSTEEPATTLSDADASGFRGGNQRRAWVPGVAPTPGAEPLWCRDDLGSWSVSHGDGSPARLLVGDRNRVVFLGPTIHVLDTGDGSTLGAVPRPGDSPGGPLLIGDDLYFLEQGDETAGLYHLDLESYAITLLATVPGGQWIHAGIAANDEYLFTSTDQGTFAIGRSTGEIVWSSEHGDTVAPILSGDLLIVGGDRGTAALDPNSGQVVWSTPWDSWYPLATDGETVFGVPQNGDAFALDIRTGDLIWEADYREENDVAPILTSTVLVMHQRDPRGFSDRIVALDPSTGIERWSTTVSSNPDDRHPVAIGSTILWQDDGELLFVEDRFGAVFHVLSDISNSPVLAGGQVYLRQADRLCIYAFDVPPASGTAEQAPGGGIGAAAPSPTQEQLTPQEALVVAKEDALDAAIARSDQVIAIAPGISQDKGISWEFAEVLAVTRDATSIRVTVYVENQFSPNSSCLWDESGNAVYPSRFDGLQRVPLGYAPTAWLGEVVFALSDMSVGSGYSFQHECITFGGGRGATWTATTVPLGILIPDE